MAQLTPTIRIFFSSTFIDFQQERNTLQAQVFPGLRQYCLERGARFLPIDLRWGIAEEAGIEQYVVRACLDEVARCQRVSPAFNFVALLGDRYGSLMIPETLPANDFSLLLEALSTSERGLVERWYDLDENGKPWVYVLKSRSQDWEGESQSLQATLTKASKRARISAQTRLTLTASVTELEIQAGVFARTDLAQPLILRRHIHSRSVPEFYLSDSKVSRKKHARLEKRLQNVFPREFVAYDATLTDGRIADASLDAFAKRMDRELRRRIDLALEQEHEAERSVLSWSFARDRLSHFTGQEEALKRLHDYLAVPVTQPMIVTGASGVGKTTLLLEVFKKAEADHPHHWGLTYFIGGSTAIATVSELIEDIERQTLANYPHPNNMTIPESAGEREGRLPEFLALATLERPLILIIDAVDQLRGTDLAHWIPRALPPNVHLLVSMLPGADVDQLHKDLSGDALLTVQPLSVQEGGELLDQWLNDSLRTLATPQREMVMAYYEAHSNPLGLRVIAEMARRWPSWKRDIPTFAPTVSLLIQQFLEELERPSRHGRVLVEESLGLIATGKQGLTEDEILAVISDQPDLVQRITAMNAYSPPTTRLPAVLWARLYSDIEWALTERNIDRARVLTFYHRQVSEAIRDRYQTPNTARGWHRNLATFFVRKPDHGPYLVNTAERPRAVVNERMVDELLYQQVTGELPGDAKHTLFDGEYLQARIQVGKTSAALDDIDDSLRSDPDVALLSETLELSQSVLDTLPQELPNQIWGRSPALHHLIHRWALWDDAHLRLESSTLSKPALDSEATPSHTKAVTACVFSPRDKRILSASRDKTLRLWSALNPFDQGEVASIWKCTLLVGHKAAINTCAFSPDGVHILSGSDDTTVNLWDGDGRLLHTWDDHIGSVFFVTFSPDGNLIASASKDNTARIYDRETHIQRHLLSGHLDAVNRIIFSPDSTRVATASSDGTARIWNLAQGTFTNFNGHTDEVTTLLFTPDGERLITGSRDNTLRVWESTGRNPESLTLTGHTARINDCALNPTKSHILLSGADDGYARLWDINTGQEIKALNIESSGVRACCFTPDGKTVVAATWGNVLIIWDWLTDHTQTLYGHAFGLNACAVDSDGLLAITGSDDKTVRVWDMVRRTQLAVLGKEADIIRACAVSPDGEYSVRGTAGGWMEIESVLSQLRLYRWNAHAGIVRGCAFSSDGESLISVSEDKLLRRWTRGTSESDIYSAHMSHIRCCAVSPDGTEMLTGGGSHHEDPILRLWRVKNPTPILELEGHTELIIDCAFSDDGRTLYSASYDNTIRAWDKATGASTIIYQGPIPPPTGLIRTFGFSADGARMAFGGSEGTVTIFDLKAQHPIMTFLAHTHYVNTCRFTADDQYLITCSSDSVVGVWELASLDPQKPRPCFIWRGNNETLVLMAFDAPRGRLFVAEDDAFHTLSLVNLTAATPAIPLPTSAEPRVQHRFSWFR